MLQSLKKKNPSSRSGDISIHEVWPQSDQNCLFGPKDDFLGKFYSSDFSLLNVPYHVAKFENNP